VSRAIVLSSTVVNGETQEIVRTEQQLRADGFAQSEIDDAVTTQILKFHYADHRIGWDAYVAAYHRVKDRVWFEDVVGSTIDPKRHSWDFWRKGNAYEPSERWREVAIPALFLFGEHDVISPVKESIALLEHAFAGDRRGLLTVETIPGATHDLFAGEDGGLYDEIEADRMSDFMARAWRWLEAGGWGSSRP
jgi:pimeloyl-ACP methyl ester carboxylesterase